MILFTDSVYVVMFYMRNQDMAIRVHVAGVTGPLSDYVIEYMRELGTRTVI